MSSKWMASGFLLAYAAIAGDFAAVPVGTGFSGPTGIASANDGSGRLFVAEHSGKVRALNPDGSSSVFLDLSGRVWQRREFCCDERGLVGITFPPGDGPKDHFFVAFVDPQSYVTVSRFSISDDSGLADPLSEVILQRLEYTEENHFGGDLAFGPLDGLLYWTMGDGTASFEVRYAQDPASPFGKILRFDAYAATQPAPLEVYALGLRNPWRFAFDPANGDLYIGDVGENTFEEVNIVPAGTAAGTMNFGWGVTEGFFCFEFGQCLTDGITFPAVAYDHDAGCSVTGGRVYRGSKHADWAGKYFYADFCFGSLWETHLEDSQWVVNPVLARSGYNISTFGSGEDGEIYFADYVKGIVYRLDEIGGQDQPVEGGRKKPSPRGKR